LEKGEKKSNNNNSNQAGRSIWSLKVALERRKKAGWFITTKE
jgi:hypothetical protein